MSYIDHKEFDELMSLAETSSENSKKYIEKVDSLRFVFRAYTLVFFFFLIIISYFIYLYFLSIRIEYIIALIGLITPLFAMVYLNYNTQINKYNKELEIEFEILKRLLDIIYEMLEVKSYNNNFSPIERAIIEMKLSRIRFSSPLNNRFRKRFT